jgi:acetyl esterase/lipase
MVNETDTANDVIIDADGTTRLPRIVIPFSNLASPEAKAAYVGLKDLPYPADITVEELRQWVDANKFVPALEGFRALYPVTIESKTIGGIKTDIVTPQSGVAPEHENHVLINLHGGGFFVGGGGLGGQAESTPVAGLGGYRVISVDYRQFPEHQFPAASEDVAAVYSELLKHYKPENIGIFGSSAGGILATQATAWFQVHGLPRPGAIGVLCASAGAMGLGDSGIIWPTNPIAPRGALIGDVSAFSGYLAGTDPKDPLVAPVFSPEVLKRFPPTVILTGSRSDEASGAYYSDLQLTKAGVESELHVWDGLWHGGFLSADLPEHEEVHQLVVNFFNKHLGRA